MRLYAGSSHQFIQDTILNQIADKLKLAFFSYYRYNPSQAEFNSWHHSLRAMKNVIQLAELDDAGVLLEYSLPQTSKRLDFMITGRGGDHRDNAVIVELKQWSETKPSEGENEVRTFLAGRIREVLHPAAQVGQYRTYLADCHTAFYEGENPIGLKACSYLHNYGYQPDDAILDKKFEALLRDNPIFSKADVHDLAEYLASGVAEGNGMEILARVEKSEYRPSKKLMEHVAKVIKKDQRYVLLDEQLIVYDKVFATVRNGYHKKQKHIVVVKGGPGTGKSVIAINLMADLLKEGYNAQYATNSRAFTKTLRRIVGSRAGVQFKYFLDYVPVKKNEIDVVIADEAHRLREKSFDRWRPDYCSNKPQIEEILRAARMSVFFIDDHQIVRSGEVGSVEHIREYAEKHNCILEEFELAVQFRCSGSEGFVSWINNTLQVQDTANVLWTGEENFDFQIFPTVEALDLAIRQKAGEGHSARMTAGYCWRWSTELDENGELVNDVVIGAYERPWNAHSRTQSISNGRPPAEYWALLPEGVGQIGCVYTAQGFEFDYVGVIVGKDLVYDFDRGEWIGQPAENKDPDLRRSGDQFVDLVKNTYRVLMSRGMKGCYVYFMDNDAERFFRSRMAKR